jgi:hypothetical protein
MKRRFYIAFLFLAPFLAACNGDKQVPEPAAPEASRRVEGPSKELSAIDSLLWRQPDSALAALQEYWDGRDVSRNVSETTNDASLGDVSGNVSTYDRHYAHLLLSELLYKNDYAQTNRPALRQAVAYFDSLTFTLNDHSSLRRLIAGGDPLSPTRNDQLFFLSARAHYINGVGYYEHDSVVEACKEYMKTLDVMEEHFEEEELMGKKAKFMALTYTHLAGLYSNYYLHEQTIYFGWFSLKYYQQYDATPWHVAWTLCDMGSQYEMKGIVDSAVYYYKKGVETLPNTNSLIYRDLTSRLAFLFYHQEGCDMSLNQLKSLLAQAESPKEHSSRCLTIGEVYFQEKEFDSAWLYLNEVYYGVASSESKRQAAEWLVEICNATGKTDEVLEYANFLVPFANINENQSGIKSQLTEQYKNYVQRRLEREHQREKMKSQRWTMVIVGSLLFLMSFIIILYLRNKKRKRQLESQIDDVKKAHEMEQKALSSRLKKSNEALRELQDQIKQQNDRDAAVEPTISFAEEPICRLILERVKEGRFKSQMDCVIYKDFALNKEQIVELHSAANRHFNQFTERLIQAYPNLTKSDLDYCCLYLLGLTDADIAALMQRAYNTINERNSKLRRIFGSENMVSVTLQAFANETISI